MVFEILLTLFVALVMSGLLLFVISPDRRDGGIWAFASVLFVIWFVTLAIGAWTTPVGPLAYGVPWLGFAFIGALVMLVIATASPPRRRHVGGPLHAGVEKVDRAEPEPAVGAAFWVLLSVAILAIAISFFARV